MMAILTITIYEDSGCDVDPTFSAKLALNAHQVDDQDGGNFDKSEYVDENILKIVAVVTIQLREAIV